MPAAFLGAADDQMCMGSEPGNSLLCPDEAPRSSVCRVLGMDQCRASLLHKQHKSWGRVWGLLGRGGGFRFLLLRTESTTKAGI